MAMFDLGDGTAIYYLHRAPTRPNAPTFVFVNALTGNTDHWEAAVAPALCEAGFGTLSYNFRGQTHSTFHPDTPMTPAQIQADLITLVNGLAPQRPVLVGLSIGGLFAAHGIAGGIDAAGLVFLNTLREINPRIAWINDALPHFAGTIGVTAFMSATFPMLVNPEYLAAVRPNFLQGGYEPLAEDHPHFRLMSGSLSADWAFPWHSLTLPVLNITGTCDRVFLDIDVVDRLLGTIPDTRRLDWDDCGHLIPLERPERLAESLLTFGTEIEGQA